MENEKKQEAKTATRDVAEKDEVTIQKECGTCKYWKPFQKPVKGECHCKAPLPCIHEPEQETFHKGTRWPLTGEHQYCGEYQIKTGGRAGTFL